MSRSLIEPEIDHKFIQQPVHPGEPQSQKGDGVDQTAPDELVQPIADTRARGIQPHHRGVIHFVDEKFVAQNGEYIRLRVFECIALSAFSRGLTA